MAKMLIGLEWMRPLMAVLALAVSPVQAQEVGMAVRVNDAEISVFRLERYFEDYLKERGRNLGAIRNPNAYKRLKRDAMERLIDRELLAQEADRQGIVIPAGEMAATWAQVVTAYKTPEAFQRRMREAGFTVASLDDYLRQDLMAQRALARLIRDAEPTEEEVRRAYGESREAFAIPEQVRARHILFRVAPGTSAEEREKVRRRLGDLAGEIRDGEDFAREASRHSEDSSRNSGGDLGYFSRGMMVPAFEEMAFSLAPGAMGGPVETPYGWHLIRVEDRQPARAMPEAEALERVRRQLAAERRAEAERQVLQRLRQAARVEVLLSL